MKKPLLLVVLVLLVLAAILLLHGQPLDLAVLRGWVRAAADWHARQPLLVAGLFMLAYVTITALSLPVAVWMTLGAGALFGFLPGLVIVSFASSIGATLAFLVARYLLRDWVEARLGHRARQIDEGLSRDGAFYLFTLRMIPVVPFFAVNLLMGLTRMRAVTFYLVSQAGMLAATAVYVNAGTQLGALTGLSGILSPGLLASFALLGIFPWLARAALAWVNRRRAYAGWTRPARFDRNLIVIGAGSAGLIGAYLGAALKARVTLIEAGKMGGDCLNYGCVPSKALIRIANLAHDMRHADRFGLTPAEPAVPFENVMARVNDAITAIAPHDSEERYQGLGVEVIHGHATLTDPWTVEVAGADGGAQRLTAKAIILATGAVPAVPDLPGLDEVGYLTSDTLWAALQGRKAVPRHMVVLGGGPIGSELAQAFARLGAEVTQIERGPRLLAREDEDVSALAEAALRADGVTVLTGHAARACGVTDGGKWIEVEGAEGRRRLPFDELIVAVGRAPRLTGYGLEALGIATGRSIETNGFLETRYPNILAAGDVAGPYQFTHVAAHQAWFAAVNALFGNLWRLKVDYRVIPWATFISPEIARVGLNEAEAREKGIAHEVTRYSMAEGDRAITDGATEGFVKVLTVPGKDCILGVTIVGEHAGDLIAEFVLAMKQGLGLNRILGTIHIYPTLAEVNRHAAGEWRRAHVSPRALRLLERFHDWRRA